MEDDLINRIERAFAAAVKAHAAPIRLEVTRASTTNSVANMARRRESACTELASCHCSRISLGNRVARLELGDPRTDCWDALRVLPSAANRHPGALIADHFAREIAAIYVGRERVLS
jgi:hypothetical protein